MVCMSVCVYLCVYSSVHQENSIRFVYLNTNSQDTSGASHVVPCLYDKYLYLSRVWFPGITKKSICGCLPTKMLWYPLKLWHCLTTGTWRFHSFPLHLPVLVFIPLFLISGNDFPSNFESLARKILKLLFHIVAHLYHCHFREIVLLNLHAHLNCVFSHLIILNDRYQLIEPRETEILQDLIIALRILDKENTSPSLNRDSASSNSMAVSNNSIVPASH